VTNLLIQGGSVLTPDGPLAADVVVNRGVVAEIGAGLSGERVIDARGMWVGPGLVDIHVHFREPGQEWKEDISTGSAAAAAGGFTAVCVMPNTVPAVDTAARARYIADRGAEVGLVDVVPVGCITEGRAGKRLADVAGMWDAGVRMFSDDGDSVADAGLMRSVFDLLAARGGVVSQHAEDRGLAGGGHMHEGEVSSRLGVPGLPAVAEEVVVARDLALVRFTGCRYHVQHVSTAGTVELVRRAKAEGLPVTAEVTPHHLSFTDSDAGSLDPDYKMYPPLRSADDVAAVRRALVDGTIDVVATDHAPHGPEESDVAFVLAPRGVIGVETSVAAVLETTGLDQATLYERMSIAPARIAGLGGHGHHLAVGAPAHITVIDPRARWTVERFRSRSHNSPWKGRTMTGRVVATIRRGSLSHLVEGATRAG
jgi:dihydroorotase